MAEPVTLAELKAHLRLSAGATGEDAYLAGRLLAARRKVELATRRSFSGEAPTLAGDDAALAAQAILLLAGHWYEDRDASGRLPEAVLWVIEDLRRWDNGE